MRREIQAMLAAQRTHPGCLLSELVCVRVSPQLKRQLTAAARERRMRVETLVREALVQVLGRR